MRTALTFFPLIFAVVACSTEPAVEEVRNAQPPQGITMPDTARGPVNVVDTSARIPGRDTTAPTERRSTASVSADPRCREEIYAENNQGRITVFIPRKQLAARTAEIRDLLPSAYVGAERSSPHSIADDFEHGISTEHSSMPDKLPVEVRVFERCRSTQPHTVLHLRVWREADGSFGSDGW